MKPHYWIVILLLVIPTACSLPSASGGFERTWHITKIETAAGDEESESLYQDSFLSFYSGGAVSFFDKNEGEYESGEKPVFRMGHWGFTNDVLNVSLQQTTVDVGFKIVEVDKKWLVLEIIRGPKESIGTVLKCQESDHFRSAKFDLLDPRNNEWRARPTGKESRALLNTRVRKHVDFLLAYFKMLDDKAQDYFEPAALQTPFRFYANGMALPNNFESEGLWLNNFYDEADAVSGGKILSQGLRSIDVYPSDGKSYTKGYYNALQLIKEYLEK